MPTESPREAFAYVAGYLDGEATIGFWCGFIEIKIDTCTPHALHFITKHFGGKVVKQLRKTKTNRTVYRVQYKRQQAINVLKHCMEFMHEKKKQAEAVLQMHELTLQIRADKKKSH